MQIVAMNGDVTSAEFLFAHLAEWELEQDFAGVPFSTCERIRVDADLTQSLVGIEMAKHLHDIRRDMNARSYSLKRASLFIKPNLKPLALQQSAGRRAAKAGADHGNAGLALHARVF